MIQNKKEKVQKSAKIIKTKIIVKPSYIGNKSSIDTFTEIIVRSMDKRKSKQLEE